MSTIGTFTPAKDGGRTGSIRTLVSQPFQPGYCSYASF